MVARTRGQVRLPPAFGPVAALCDKHREIEKKIEKKNRKRKSGDFTFEDPRREVFDGPNMVNVS